jgi:HEAT repeat protein
MERRPWRAHVSKKSYDKKLEDLQALRSSPESATPQLRKALQDRNNYVVSKAAAIAAELGVSDLIPDLLAAFDHFMTDPLKSDPQCWAKNAVAKALKDVGHRGPQVYIRGLAHVQYEPVWGGRADSAATLRGICAHALVETHLDDLEILGYLGDALADPEKPVRMDAATAIAQLGRPEGALLLRLKALLGDAESDVVGQCFLCLVTLTPRDAVPFLSKFLKTASDDIRLEAAAALAQSREAEALELLKTFWRERLSPQLRRAVVTALAACPQAEAADWLLSLVTTEPADVAATALEALAASRFRADVRERARTAAAASDDPQVARKFDKVFG